MGTTVPDVAGAEEGLVIISTPNPLKTSEEAVKEPRALKVSKPVEVVDVAMEEEDTIEKLENVKGSGSVLPTVETSNKAVGGTKGKKDQLGVKKRKGEAEKLWEDINPQPRQGTMTVQKGGDKMKEVQEDPKIGAGGSREHRSESNSKLIDEEPTIRRGAKRTAKDPKPSKKKNMSKNMKFPPVRVSDDSRRKVLVLNVIGFLCDIRPMHDGKEWGSSGTIHYDREFKVKIKKMDDCAAFVGMLHSQFDVGIWALVGEAILQEVARFLARGTTMKCFLWGKEIGGRERDLHDIFDMIPDPTHGPARVLRVDCDSKVIRKLPSRNVLHIPAWDPLLAEDKFLKKLRGPSEVFS